MTMDIRIIHFYPDLMSLYGSYANVAVLRQYLQELGNTVTVETVAPGDDAALADADFLFMGAGTERSQKAALADFLRFGSQVKAAAEAGTAMLFAGTAMELLGASITDDAGTVFQGVGLAAFTAVQGKKRFVGDLYGTTELYPDAVVGFMNKCSLISGVETPLLTGAANGLWQRAGGRPRGLPLEQRVCLPADGPHFGKKPPPARVRGGSHLCPAGRDAAGDETRVALRRGGLCHHGGAAAPAGPAGEKRLNSGRRSIEFQTAAVTAFVTAAVFYEAWGWDVARRAHSVSLRVCRCWSTTLMDRSSHVFRARVFHDFAESSGRDTPF